MQRKLHAFSTTLVLCESGLLTAVLFTQAEQDRQVPELLAPPSVDQPLLSALKTPPEGLTVVLCLRAEL